MKIVAVVLAVLISGCSFGRLEENNYQVYFDECAGMGKEVTSIKNTYIEESPDNDSFVMVQVTCQ